MISRVPDFIASIWPDKELTSELKWYFRQYLTVLAVQGEQYYCNQIFTKCQKPAKQLTIVSAQDVRD